MEPIEVSRIDSFIEKLAQRAHHGLNGEKPLAMIAAIEFIHSGFEEDKPEHNASLTELLTSQITSNAIKTKFVALAQKTGKLKAPDWSWGNIVSYGYKLTDELKNNNSVDNAFRYITREQALEFLKYYYRKLGFEYGIE